MGITMNAETLSMASRQEPRTGDRVRICVPPGKSCARVLHSGAERGQLGNVVRIDPAESHPYFVIFDRPIPWPSQVLFGEQPPIPLWASHYDADELEPIED